ncbi:acyl-CoA dehydrogenase, partial [Escherichia coli]|nr:acyl-CoA dehydrogenase [Escherichia coli]
SSRSKVDGEHFTAFIVEKGFEGLSLGPEEKKMGIKGSSTRPVVYEDCLVPVENVLGQVGKGHLIALNVLNLGRFNLGSACMGAAKYA